MRGAYACARNRRPRPVSDLDAQVIMFVIGNVTIACRC